MAFPARARTSPTFVPHSSLLLLFSSIIVVRSYNHTQCADWYLFINTLCCFCYALKRLLCLNIKRFIIDKLPDCPLTPLYFLCNSIKTLYCTPCLVIQCIISHQLTQRTLTCLYILSYAIQITHRILCVCNQLHYFIICLRIID